MSSKEMLMAALADAQSRPGARAGMSLSREARETGGLSCSIDTAQPENYATMSKKEHNAKRNPLISKKRKMNRTEKALQ